MFHYVYVLENKEKEIYVGYTINLKKRLREHNQKQNFSTKFKIPWHIIYCEACINSIDAKRREQYLKTSQGGRMLKLRLTEYFKHRKIS